MKNKWMNRCHLLVLPFLVTGLAGCTFENGTEIETEYFTVNKRDWQWNGDYGRYECIIDYPALSTAIYESGTVLGGVFIIESDANGEYEVLKTLPYVATIPNGNNTYTRTTSFDIAPGQITFYIQSSDLKNSPDDTANYEFKITLIWEQDHR
jgi:hypothetical protein